MIYGRYRWTKQDTNGTGQVTPPGLTTSGVLETSASTFVWNSIWSSSVTNELRASYARYDSDTNAVDPSSETIPSIEISDLGMLGFNAAANRTAIGLAVNLPQFRINNTYQIQDSISVLSGNHSMKFGVDFRMMQVKSFFFPTVRGRLAYSSLQNYVNDLADIAATINKPMPGGDVIGFYEWNEFYLFAQDQWKIAPNFTLSFGLRYEYPGDSFKYLKDLSVRVLAANGNNPGLTFTPVPSADTNNFMPRFGFNWNPQTSDKGFIGFLTGGNRLVIRGGYARTFDANFVNINLNVASAFPFVAAVNVTPQGAYAALPTIPGGLGTTPPAQFTRTVVAEDFRAPVSDQFSFEIQRELTKDMVFKIGYVGTLGRALFQSIDGNPRRQNVTSASCVSFGPLNPTDSCRVNSTQGVIRLRGNFAESDYHSLQTSIEKRLSKGFSAGLHYTFSSFIDTASEVFNPSGGEVAIAQDSFNIAADRGRSSYDRPHRLTGNFVYELPWFQDQQGFVGHLLGGWQVNSFFTVQSGAPFTVLQGSDPAGALSGISGLVGNAIRPNLRTNLNLGSMTMAEIRAQCGTPITSPASAANYCPNLFSLVTAAQRIGSTGRNTLRADGIENIDFGLIKNTRITENVRFQLRADMFNVMNRRNFGIPTATLNSSAFLNEWATNGGNRRIILGGRLVF